MILLAYVNCISRAVLSRYTDYCVYVNKYHVSAQGVDKCIINVHFLIYFYSYRH